MILRNFTNFPTNIRLGEAYKLDKYLPVNEYHNYICTIPYQLLDIYVCRAECVSIILYVTLSLYPAKNYLRHVCTLRENCSNLFIPHQKIEDPKAWQKPKKIDFTSTKYSGIIVLYS